MLKEYRVDLHVHTCLSPCADETMSPRAVVRQAGQQHLDGIGVSDHNTAENVASARKAAEAEGLHVLGGMEVTSREEAHILTFFDDAAALAAMQEMVYDGLEGENDESFFGTQLLVDENDGIVGRSKRLLIGSTGLGADEVVERSHDLGGIAIASHVDRESFSLIGQLGMIPEGMALDALELSPRASDEQVENCKCLGFPLVRSSDAHYLADIGKSYTTFRLETLSVVELIKALKGADGRGIVA